MNSLDYIEQLNLPIGALIGVALINTLLFLVLKLIRKYLFVLIKSDLIIERVTSIWERITVVIWITMIVFSIIYLLNQSFVITTVILALMLLLGGKYWLDVATGIILRIENRVAVGDYLSNDQYKGLVQNIGVRGLQLRLNTGEDAFVTYRQLSDFVVRKMDNDHHNEINTITVTIKPEYTVDIAVQKLRTEILLIPYTILTKPVQIEVIDTDESGTQLRAVLFTQTNDSGKLAEKALIHNLGNQELLVR